MAGTMAQEGQQLSRELGDKGYLLQRELSGEFQLHGTQGKDKHPGAETEASRHGAGAGEPAL